MKRDVEKPERNASLGPSGQDSQQPTEFTGTKRVLATDERGASPNEPHLRQPNERDESADEHKSAPRNVMRQAYDDVQSGQQDTDARNRVAEILPDVPKTPQRFDQKDTVEQQPLVKKDSGAAPTPVTPISPAET